MTLLTRLHELKNKLNQTEADALKNLLSDMRELQGFLRDDSFSTNFSHVIQLMEHILKARSEGKKTPEIIERNYIATLTVNENLFKRVDILFRKIAQEEARIVDTEKREERVEKRIDREEKAPKEISYEWEILAYSGYKDSVTVYNVGFLGRDLHLEFGRTIPCKTLAGIDSIRQSILAGHNNIAFIVICYGDNLIGRRTNCCEICLTNSQPIFRGYDIITLKIVYRYKDRFVHQEATLSKHIFISDPLLLPGSFTVDLHLAKEDRTLPDITYRMGFIVRKS